MAKHGKYIDGIEEIILLDGTKVIRKYPGALIFMKSPIDNTTIAYEVFNPKKLKMIQDFIEKVTKRKALAKPEVEFGIVVT